MIAGISKSRMKQYRLDRSLMRLIMLAYPPTRTRASLTARTSISSAFSDIATFSDGRRIVPKHPSKHRKLIGRCCVDLMRLRQCLRNPGLRKYGTNRMAWKILCWVTHLASNPSLQDIDTIQPTVICVLIHFAFQLRGGTTRDKVASMRMCTTRNRHT